MCAVSVSVYMFVCSSRGEEQNPCARMSVCLCQCQWAANVPVPVSAVGRGGAFTTFAMMAWMIFCR
jgi:hypothetical protein